MAVDEIVGVPGLLCSIAEELRQADPDEHIVQFNPQTWLTQFPEDGDIASLLELHPGEISRRDVLDVAPVRASDNSRTRQFAMAVMIWGYGTVGYGAHRTSLMLAARSAVEKLSAGASYVAKGDLANACLYFRNAGALPQFGWSFFTKYFYFVAAAAGTKPMALILDGVDKTSGVAGGMKQLADSGDAEAEESMRLWWSSSDRICAAGYAQYVQLVNRWAGLIGCRPDAVEMALWKGL